MTNDFLREKIINRNKGVTSLRDYAEGWNFRLESIHEPPLSGIETAWDAEIVRRVESYKKREVATYSAEDVFAGARRIAP